jgi:hypothetical protein
MNKFMEDFAIMSTLGRQKITFPARTDLSGEMSYIKEIKRLV